MNANQLPSAFRTLSEEYKRHGFSLYLIGGTSRDLLLGIEPSDMDFVTDATPEQERPFLPGANYRFAEYGSIKVQWEGQSIDVTTLRKESGYADHRHPSHIEFIDSLEEDSLRRDFTINALYVDENGNVFDFHGGLRDLENKTIRFIGDPKTRILEDPLRILRAERFASRLGFSIEPKTQEAMDLLRGELSKLNPEKVSMEKKKV
ncbi:MAG: CCA tRNA nucleotidyltransferase [Bacilli bacterium]|nr:CCA tRNA nucleotidyltransferase [Bacilli bacterium]